MNMRNQSIGAALAASGLLLLGAARADAPLPPVQHYGAVPYLSGGIGETEASAMAAAGKDWPLTLEFAVRDGAHADYAANVAVRIRDTRGHEVLQADADGPFLLARLHPGAYVVDATLGGRTLHQRLLLKPESSRKVVLVWPARGDGAVS